MAGAWMTTRHGGVCGSFRALQGKDRVVTHAAQSGDQSLQTGAVRGSKGPLSPAALIRAPQLKEATRGQVSWMTVSHPVSSARASSTWKPSLQPHDFFFLMVYCNMPTQEGSAYISETVTTGVRDPAKVRTPTCFSI